MVFDKTNILTVVIPTYNAEKTVINTLKSVMASVDIYPNIIGVDDGSKDDSGLILDTFAYENESVLICHQYNGGSSKARNTGIQLSKSDYVTFVDSDDTIENDMYTVMCNYATQNDLDCVECGINKVYKGKTINSPIVSEDILLMNNEMICDKVIKPLLGRGQRWSIESACNKIFKLSIITQNHLRFNELRTAAEDWEFSIDYYRCCERTGFIANTFYNYIRYSSNTLINRYSEWYEVSLQNRSKFMGYFPDWDLKVGMVSYLLRPIEAVGNVRVFFSGQVADEKIKNIFRVAKEYHVYQNAIPENCSSKDRNKILALKRSVDANDYALFMRITYRYSHKPVLMAKVKHFLKRFFAR